MLDSRIIRAYRVMVRVSKVSRVRIRRRINVSLRIHISIMVWHHPNRHSTVYWQVHEEAHSHAYFFSQVYSCMY